MAKQGAKTAVPRLRFPEFQKSDGWKPTPLGKSGTFIRGLTYGAGDVQDDGLLVIRSTNIQDGDLVLEKDLVFVGKKCLPEQTLQLGDVAICMSNGSKALVGKSAEYFGNHAGPITVGAFCSIFRPSLAFAKLAFKSDSYANYVALAIGGGNINNLKNSDLESFVFAIPISASEQQKVADCLTSLDEVIAAQGRKVEALKAHKRGLMQQLFPREGETRPRLRFLEFRDAPEWEAEKLGELTSIVRGGSPRPIDNFLTSDADGLNWLKIGDVDRDAMYVTKTEEKVRPEALAKTRVIHPGDFILSNSMSFGRPYISTIDTCIHDGWIAVTSIPDTLNREFLYYSILSERSQSYFADQAAGSGVQNLNKDIIKLLALGLPTVAEQQRIADCLSSLDTQITAETHQLAALKAHKQGLMQQLFPAPEAAGA